MTSGTNFGINNPLRQCSVCGGGSVGGDICPWCGENFNDPLVIKLEEAAQKINKIDHERRQLITDRDSLLGQIAIRKRSKKYTKYSTLKWFIFTKCLGSRINDETRHLQILQLKTLIWHCMFFGNISGRSGI